MRRLRIKGIKPIKGSKMEEFKQLKMQDLSSASTQELKELVQYGIGVLNPRIKRLEKDLKEYKGELAEDSYKWIKETGGLFTTASRDPDRVEMSRNELLHELKREIEFANMKTSTVTGAQEVRKERESIVSVKYAEEQYNKKQLELDESERVPWEKLSQEEKENIVSEEWGQLPEESRSDMVENEWESFKKFKERHPNVPSNVLLEIYITCNGNPEAMENMVQEWQNEQEMQWKQAYEEAERQSNYRPSWDDFSL